MQIIEAAPAVFACELNVKDRDLRKLLTDEEKKKYDEFQAVEVFNVVRERAVRALTSRELEGVDHSKVMGMRWVLTRKATGAAKPRLVVSGYQAHNLLDVETPADLIPHRTEHAPCCSL